MKERFEAMLKALIAEKKQEVETYRSLVGDRPMKERISEGVTLYPLDFFDQRYTPFDELILDFRINPEQSGKLFGTSGKCQLFHSENNLPVDATILKSSEGLISIVLHADEIPEWIKEGKIGLNAVCDTRTYDIQIKALQELLETQRGLVFDFYHKKLTVYNSPDFSENPELNQSQNNAVRSIVSGGQLTIVHGPPGTGKTKTLVAAIQKLVTEGKRILVATPTNAAADHITHEIFKSGVSVLRYGNSFKIHDKVQALTLYSRIQNHPDLAVAVRLGKEAEAIRKKAYRYVRNFGPEEQAERKQLRQELKEIRKDIRSIEKQIREYTLQKGQVITGTLIGLQHDEILNQKFDIVFVDEAGQALEPAIWSLARHVDSLVMAGDPFQLPPNLFSNEAIQSPLSVSLIEMGMTLNHPTFLLNIQYRMNDLIMQFSNQKFYKSQLTSANQNAEQHLKNDLFLPLEFIDTAGCGFDENKNDLGEIGNKEEAGIVVKRVMELIPENKSIGVISPYRKQIQYLKEAIAIKEISIQTIDSFQGQERDIIVLSLVRSNSSGELGFLKDYRRLNVAMTRAKFKLVIIGDSSTLGSDLFFSDLLAFIETKGSYRSAYEYFE